MHQTPTAKLFLLLTILPLILSACQATATPVLPIPTVAALPSPTASLIPPPTLTPVPTVSADEVAIRAARQAMNNAFAKRDFGTLVKHFSANISLVGPAFRGNDANQVRTGLQSTAGSRPDVVATFDPEEIQINDFGLGVASESGTWHESWTESGAPTTLTGTYTALWRKTDTGWLLDAEVLIPLTCTGRSYCNH